MLDEWFGQKALKLPTPAKEWIVKVAPIFAIIGVVLSALGVLSMWGLGARFGMYYRYGMMGYGGMWGGGFGLTFIFTLVILILYVMAIPGLRHRQASGWNYSFYAVLVNGVGQFLMFNIIGLIISLAISFYILFQVKPYYFGGVTISTSPTPKNSPRPQV